MEFDLLFWRTALAGADAMEHVYDFDATSLATSYPPCRNQVTKMPRLSADEVVPAHVHPDAFGASRLPMLRPEKNSIQMMKFFMNTFSKTGETVLDTFDATFGTAKLVLFLIPERRKMHRRRFQLRACGGSIVKRDPYILPASSRHRI